MLFKKSDLIENESWLSCWLKIMKHNTHYGTDLKLNF